MKLNFKLSLIFVDSQNVTRSLCPFIKVVWLCIDENFQGLELFFLREMESHTCYFLDLSPRNFATFQGLLSLQVRMKKLLGLTGKFLKFWSLEKTSSKTKKSSELGPRHHLSWWYFESRLPWVQWKWNLYKLQWYYRSFRLKLLFMRSICNLGRRWRLLV